MQKVNVIESMAYGCSVMAIESALNKEEHTADDLIREVRICLEDNPTLNSIIQAGSLLLFAANLIQNT